MSRKWTHEQISDQTGRTAIVTGANSGLGFATAKALAQKGAQVILAVRNLTLGREAAARMTGNVHVRELDLASLESVKRFSDKMLTELDSLDLLINNAGVMMPPKREETSDGFELQLGTNHLGHFALTAQLLPLLVNTPRARIVNVSSLAHKMAMLDLDDLQWETTRYHRRGSYGNSKLANLLFTFELQRRLSAAGTDTLVVASHPGWTGTNLQKYLPGAGLFNAAFAMKPWKGALPTLYAATDSSVRGADFYGPGGPGEVWGYPVRVGCTAEARDTETAARLWEISEELTGVVCKTDVEGLNYPRYAVEDSGHTGGDTTDAVPVH